MNIELLEDILQNVRDKKISINEALQKLKALPYQNLDFAKVDTHRSLRKGFPERNPVPDGCQKSNPPADQAKASDSKKISSLEFHNSLLCWEYFWTVNP